MRMMANTINEGGTTMSNTNHNAASLLTREMLTGTMASLSLTHEINKELQETVNGISMGDENLLERVGLFVNRHSAEYRFDKLRDKVAAYIGERKALIEAGNKLLHQQGMQTVPEKADYGLSKCQAQWDSSHTNTEWDERMQDAYDRMQACIEAVEADITECQTLLGTLH
jgi:hypothetical protein